jgi:hypothetical protein
VFRLSQEMSQDFTRTLLWSRRTHSYRKTWQKQMFHLQDLRRLNHPRMAVRLPLPKNWPRVNLQLPIVRSPDSPHRLHRNFRDIWVTSCATSPPKELHLNALNQRETQILALVDG